MAANVGQIVYDLYYTKDCRISTSNDGRIIKSTEADYETKRIDIKTDICKGKIITKLGIQAPPGTQFTASSRNGTGEKLIRVGQTGIFELIENLSINQLAFVGDVKDVIIDYTYEI